MANMNLFEKYGILTSSRIQKRYLEAVSRRKGLKIKDEYLLVNYDQNRINVGNNSINADNNCENDSNNTQIKENKIKKYKNNKFNNFPQRDDYDFNELEKQLLQKDR